MNQDEQSKVIDQCFAVVEEMKNGSYADPEGKHAHFFSYPTDDQENVFQEILDDENEMSVNEIVGEAIERAFVHLEPVPAHLPEEVKRRTE